MYFLEKIKKIIKKNKISLQKKISISILKIHITITSYLYYQKAFLSNINIYIL